MDARKTRSRENQKISYAENKSKSHKGLCLSLSDFPDRVRTGVESVVKRREGQKKWVEVSGAK